MPALAFGAYFLYAYVVLPISYRSLASLYSNRFQICPLVVCMRPLIRCVQEPECSSLLEELQECQDETSVARQKSAAKFAHVQHPQDPTFCRYQCFDTITTQTALDLLECMGGSGCLEPSLFSDECAAISEPVLPFDETIEHVLPGSWVKLYTTGWDQWPCQWTEFRPPLHHQAAVDDDAAAPPPLAPEPWMKSWPTAPNVWRMDLYWTNDGKPSTPNNKNNVTFHMCNEMYPHEMWTFASQPSAVKATLRTRAVMWGTEAHENWYLLDYHAASQTMLVYYCAYTMDIHRFDSMAMVLRKKEAEENQGPLSDAMAQSIEQKALQLLGEKFGRLQRVEKCE